MLVFNYPTPVPLGDQCSIPFAITNPDGTPYDYTGHLLKLFFSDTPNDTGAYVATKSTADGGLTSVSPAGGTGNVNFLLSDPMVGKSYYYGFRDETADVTLSTGMWPFQDHPGR